MWVVTLVGIILIVIGIVLVVLSVWGPTTRPRNKTATPSARLISQSAVLGNLSSWVEPDYPPGQTFEGFKLPSGIYDFFKLGQPNGDLPVNQYPNETSGEWVPEYWVGNYTTSGGLYTSVRYAELGTQRPISEVLEGRRLPHQYYKSIRLEPNQHLVFKPGATGTAYGRETLEINMIFRHADARGYRYGSSSGGAVPTLFTLRHQGTTVATVNWHSSNRVMQVTSTPAGRLSAIHIGRDPHPLPGAPSLPAIDFEGASQKVPYRGWIPVKIRLEKTKAVAGVGGTQTYGYDAFWPNGELSLPGFDEIILGGTTGLQGRPELTIDGLDYYGHTIEFGHLSIGPLKGGNGNYDMLYKLTPIVQWNPNTVFSSRTSSGSNGLNYTATDAVYGPLEPIINQGPILNMVNNDGELDDVNWSIGHSVAFGSTDVTGITGVDGSRPFVYDASTNTLTFPTGSGFLQHPELGGDLVFSITLTDDTAYEFRGFDDPHTSIPLTLQHTYEQLEVEELQFSPTYSIPFMSTVRILTHVNNDTVDDLADLSIVDLGISLSTDTAPVAGPINGVSVSNTSTGEITVVHNSESLRNESRSFTVYYTSNGLEKQTSFTVLFLQAETSPFADAGFGQIITGHHTATLRAITSISDVVVGPIVYDSPFLADRVLSYDEELNVFTADVDNSTNAFEGRAQISFTILGVRVEVVQRFTHIGVSFGSTVDREIQLPAVGQDVDDEGFEIFPPTFQVTFAPRVKRSDGNVYTGNSELSTLIVPGISVSESGRVTGTLTSCPYAAARQVIHPVVTGYSQEYFMTAEALAVLDRTPTVVLLPPVGCVHSEYANNELTMDSTTPFSVISPTQYSVGATASLFPPTGPLEFTPTITVADDGTVTMDNSTLSWEAYDGTTTHVITVVVHFNANTANGDEKTQHTLWFFRDPNDYPAPLNVTYVEDVSATIRIPELDAPLVPFGDIVEGTEFTLSPDDQEIVIDSATGVVAVQTNFNTYTSRVYTITISHPDLVEVLTRVFTLTVHGNEATRPLSQVVPRGSTSTATVKLDDEGYRITGIAASEINGTAVDAFAFNEDTQEITVTVPQTRPVAVSMMCRAQLIVAGAPNSDVFTTFFVEPTFGADDLDTDLAPVYPNHRCLVGDDIVVAPVFSDPLDPEVIGTTYSLDVAPTGLSINASTGIITGSITEPTDATTVTVGYKQPTGPIGTVQSFQLTVEGVFAFDDTNEATVELGTPITLFPFSDFNVKNIKVVGAHPEITVNDNGSVTIHADEAGTFELQFTADGPMKADLTVTVMEEVLVPDQQQLTKDQLHRTATRITDEAMLISGVAAASFGVVGIALGTIV